VRLQAEQNPSTWGATRKSAGHNEARLRRRTVLLWEEMAKEKDVVNGLLSKNAVGAYYWLQVLVHEGGAQPAGWFGLNLQ
jgi:hypothetical protein